ncbi:hypothetical protein [Kribbella qitaiheensis]|uniref:hypothetical protein n=1 Tax=Kribbella qitaiheensis TaxID=1544730 RepID=UPI0016270507|nr:hypothetical protein [Kribbella qitaiheensis]
MTTRTGVDFRIGAGLLRPWPGRSGKDSSAEGFERSAGVGVRSVVVVAGLLTRAVGVGVMMVVGAAIPLGTWSTDIGAA